MTGSNWIAIRGHRVSAVHHSLAGRHSLLQSTSGFSLPCRWVRRRFQFISCASSSLTDTDKLRMMSPGHQSSLANILFALRGAPSPCKPLPTGWKLPILGVVLVVCEADALKGGRCCLCLVGGGGPPTERKVSIPYDQIHTHSCKTRGRGANY